MTNTACNNDAYSNLLDLLFQTLEKNVEEFKMMIQDSTLKRVFIQRSTTSQFSHFVAYEDIDTILSVLDEEGILYLEKSLHAGEKVRSILSNHCPALIPLLKKKSFLKLVYKFGPHNNFESISSFSLEEATLFLRYVEEQFGRKRLIELMRAFEEEEICGLIDNFQLNRKELLPFVLYGPKVVSEQALSKLITINNFSYENLDSLVERSIHIPKHLLEESAFLQKMVTMDSVKSYRLLVEKMKLNHDVSYMETLRKKYYESRMASFHEGTGLLRQMERLYDDIIHSDIQMWYEQNLSKYFSFFGDSANEDILLEEIQELVSQKNFKVPLLHYLQRESSIWIANMIVDYHFEEVPHNLFLDMQELCNYASRVEEILSPQKLELYRRILSLDSLPHSEKMRLHEALKKYPIQEEFYDDMRRARNHCYQRLGDSLLNEQSILPFYDEASSLKYGVPIYVVKEELYYALIKCITNRKDEVLQKDDLWCDVDAASYSIDGPSKFKLFYSPKEYYTFIYFDLPVSQVLHIFPLDSYSSYDRVYNLVASNYRNFLMSPKQLLDDSDDYNEIVIAQRNTRREDEVNNRLVMPKMFGIYTYDAFSEKDIESAKNLGLAIVVVKTRSYRRHRREKPIFERDKIEHLTESEKIKKKLKYVADMMDEDISTRR